MRTENTSKLLLRLRLKQNNYKKCLLLERQLLTKKLQWNKRNWPASQQHPLQLSKKRMMVILRLLKKSRLKWLLPKLPWIKVYKKRIIELPR